MRFFDKPIAFDLRREQIRQIITNEDVQVVSFDIFDTLLVRPCLEPKDAFFLLQEKVKQKYHLDFVKLRYDAESKLGMENATLQDIWQYIGKTNNISQKITDELMHLEVDLEIDLLEAQPDVYQIFEDATKAGKRVIAVSDMYLPGSVLSKALGKNGYQGIDQIYVSCECHARKSTGKLYDYVLKEEGITHPAQLVHIGDNYRSDYQIPLNKGILAIYHSSIWENLFSYNSWWHELSQNDHHLSDDPYIRILFSYIFLRYQTGRESESDYQKRRIPTICEFAQYILSPMLLAIVKDMQNVPVHQYNKLLFAARDGYMPKKIYDLTRASSECLASEYLYVSRRALAFTEYKDFFDYFDSKGQMEISYPLGSYIETSLVDKKLSASIVSRLKEEEKEIDLKTDFEKARKVVSRFAKELNAYFAQQRKWALQYYQGILEPSENYLVFDCGYSGSVARGLSHTRSDSKFDKYYLWQTEDNKKSDQKYHTKTICMSDHPVPFGFNIICEEFFSPLQGSCIGFREERGGVVPVFETEMYSEAMQSDLQTAQRICVDFAKAFMGKFATYWNGFDFKDKNVFERIYEAAFLHTPYTNFKLLRNICFPDAFAREGNHTLEAKVIQTYEDISRFVDVMQETGFADPWNYVSPQDIRPLPVVKQTEKIGIHIHMYYIHLYNEVIAYLSDFTYPFDLIVTVSSQRLVPIIKRVFTVAFLPMLHKLIVLPVENRGRDVAPWLVTTKQYQNDYTLFCHIHAKESFQYGPGEGDRWRRYLFDNLITREAGQDIIWMFQKDNSLGCVFPAIYKTISDIHRSYCIPVGGEFNEKKIINGLLKKMSYPAEYCRSDNLFSMGTMMWYRPEAMKPLFDLNLQYKDFPSEPIGVGGTIAHAIERSNPLPLECHCRKSFCMEQIYKKYARYAV